MDGLIDPKFTIQNQTSSIQNFTWYILAYDVHRNKITPIKNDTGSGELQPGKSVSQNFDWVRITGDVCINEVYIRSVDDQGNILISFLAQTVYDDDTTTISKTMLEAIITPDQIIFTSRIGAEKSQVFVGGLYFLIGILILALIIVWCISVFGVEKCFSPLSKN